MSSFFHFPFRLRSSESRSELISDMQAAVPLRISSLHPAEHWSPILPGRAKTSLSYEEVSQQCGYTSVVTFRRAFMTETGISPRECRMRSCRVDVRFCSNMRTDGACDLSSEERTVRSDG